MARSPNTWCRTEASQRNCPNLYFTGIGQDQACTDTRIEDPPIRVASILITMTGKCKEEFGYSLYEVEAYGPAAAQKNLVTGGTAWASSEQNGFPAKGAIDGRMDTRWGSEWEVGQSQLRIDLPDPSEVYCIVLVWERACAVEYEVSLTPVE